MPTDLTGTPTSLGIGTYNVDADAPSGLGFNAAMAQIDTLLAARVTTPGGIAAGEAMVWNGSAWVRSSATQITANGIGSGVVKSPYRKTTIKSVVNTVTETDLLNGEITIAANAMGTTGALRLTAWGDWANSTGTTQSLPRFKLKLGSTVLLATSGVAAVWATAAPNYPWRIVCEILNSAANAQAATSFIGDAAGSFLNNIFGAFVTGLGIDGSNSSDQWKAVGTGTGSVDTTVSQVLGLTVILPVASALCDINLRGALVEIL